MTEHVGEYPQTKMIAYPFPLRPDVTVKLALPTDLTTQEVARLTAFMGTLVKGGLGPWL